MAEPITNVLGTVAIKHRGEYDAEANYEKLNVVSYNGSSYCAKTSTQGNLPTNTDYWDLMAEKGDKGDTGDDGYTPVKGTDYYTVADKAELESTLASDVTNEVTEQIGEISTGTPLVASSTDDMTDTTRIYVNTTDGHWYWYNGANWTDGGTYQAAEDSLTVDLLDEHLEPFETERLNLIEPNSWIDGKYINDTNGNVGNGGSTHSVTDYIYLEANTKYYFGGFNNGFLAFYNLNKEFIPNNNYVQRTGAFGTIETDVNCYIRMTTNTVWKTYNYISKYADFPTNYNEYGLKYLDIYNLVKSRGKATGNYNLFNNCGYFSLAYANGTRDYASNIITTDFIPIKGTLYYRIFNGKQGDIQYVFEYDSDKTFIKWNSTGTPKGKVELDEDTRYVRLRSNTASSSFELPSLDFYYKNLFVCDKEEYLEKYVPNEMIIRADDVSYDFFKSSATFNRSFVKEAMDSYINTIESSSYDLVVPIMTDLHTEQFESYSMLNYLASDGFADVCFNLGDNIPENYNTRQQAVDFMKQFMFVSNSKPRKSELYVLRGNHDTNPTQTNPPATADINKMIDNSLYYSLSDFRNKKGIANSGCNYGYIDTNAKIRIIFLDTSDIYDDTNIPITSGYNVSIGQKQLDWFCNDALNFMDKKDKEEWSVVILSHARLDSFGTGFATILQAFMNGAAAEGTTTISGITTNPIVLSFNVDFTHQGSLEFICGINGHLHEDNDKDFGTTGRKLISIACDNGTAYHYVSNTKTAYTRTKGTIEEHLVDTLCVDKKAKTITMKRLGVGTDRTYSYE